MLDLNDINRITATLRLVKEILHRMGKEATENERVDVFLTYFKVSDAIESLETTRKRVETHEFERWDKQALLDRLEGNPAQ